MINPLNQTTVTYGISRLSTRQAPAEDSQVPKSELPQKVSTNETRVELHSSRSYQSTSTYSAPATRGATEVAAVAEPVSENNPYAQTILSFIGLQLQRDVADGATQEELQSRLQAGYDGFLKGYGEAFEQLSASGVLDEATTAAIQETYSQVLDGVTALAEELGLENPVKDGDRLPEPVAVDDTSADPILNPVMITDGLPEWNPTGLQSRDQLNLDIIQQFREIESTLDLGDSQETESVNSADRSNGYGYRVSDTRDFNFTLKTSEGDEVTVSISAGRVGDAQYSADGEGAGLVLYGEKNSAFNFSVKGDLNEDELQAINDLVSKVGDISSAFFDGNLSQAFDLASDLNLEGDQIQSFALNLKMTKTEQSSGNADVYSPKMVGRSAERNQYNGFANMLDSAAAMVDEVNLPRSLVADLLDYVNSITRPEESNSRALGAIAQEYLGAAPDQI